MISRSGRKFQMTNSSGGKVRPIRPISATLKAPPSPRATCSWLAQSPAATLPKESAFMMPLPLAPPTTRAPATRYTKAMPSGG